MEAADRDLEDIAAAKGGLLDLDSLDATSAAMLADVASWADSLMTTFRPEMPERWAKRPLRVGFTNATSVGAWATKKPNTDIILITRGAVEKIYGTMTGLLSVPAFLPEIGSHADGPVPEGPLPNGFPPLPLFEKVLPEGPIEVYYPEDPVRGALAQDLAVMALHFLLLHEVGHIVAGHLELLASASGEACIAEFDRSSRMSRATIPRYIIECDADAFSAHVSSYVGLNYKLDSMWEETFDWKGVPGAHAAFITYATAISVLFRIFDEQDAPIERPSPSDYPHPAVRSNFVIGRAFGLAMGAGRLKRSDLLGLLQKSAMRVESVWASLGLPGRHFDLTSDAARQIVPLSSELVAEYKSWWGELSKFARMRVRWQSPWPSQS
jgi:hypothetical protein